MDESKADEMVKGLLPINCFYNFKIAADGKCYSSECMLNQDLLVSANIHLNGCMVYEKHPEVKKMREEVKKMREKGESNG